MDNVTSLYGDPIPSNEPNEALIKVIKKILTDAESGELQSFFAIGFMNDGTRMSAICSYHTNAYEVIGSIELLKQTYIRDYTDF